MSNGALWATSTAPAANSRNDGSTEVDRWARRTTIWSVMPVSTLTNGLIGTPGSTRVANSPSTSPPRTLTAPISVMASVPDAPPVVSRSTTTKVVVAQRLPEAVVEVVEAELAGGRGGHNRTR